MNPAVKHTLEVVQGPTGAPWAVFGAESETAEALVAWSGRFEAFAGIELAARLLPLSAIFSVVLTARWGRLVVCTPEFDLEMELRWQMVGTERSIGDRPRGFVMEVLE